MSYLFIALSLLFITHTKDPQPKNGRLSIQTTGQVTLTADQVEFNININAEANSPQKAFSLHKKREQALVKLLKKYKVDEKNIHYQPVSIRKNVANRHAKMADTSYVTSQSVHLSLTNFDAFQNIQVGLINHHYDDFNASFSSTKMEKGKDEALKAALKKAKEKAHLIAKEAGVKLGEIKKINYGTNYRIQQNQSFKASRIAEPSGSLNQYGQTVTVTASISIEYAISDNDA